MPAFLDLKNRDLTLDFIVEHVAYLPETDRRRVLETVEKIHAGERMTQQGLTELAWRVGKKSWPARRALEAFLKTKSGCDEEWRMTVAAVSNSTAYLLERFRHGTKCTTLDETLGHEESSSAFRDVEQREIAEVRRHVRETIWRLQQKEMASLLAQQTALLQAIQIRLDALRELADATPAIQDEVLSKIARFEDDLYFAGKELDVKRLDAEVAYYREAKELPVQE